MFRENSMNFPMLRGKRDQIRTGSHIVFVGKLCRYANLGFVQLPAGSAFLTSTDNHETLFGPPICGPQRALDFEPQPISGIDHWGSASPQLDESESPKFT